MLHPLDNDDLASEPILTIILVLPPTLSGIESYPNQFEYYCHRQGLWIFRAQLLGVPHRTSPTQSGGSIISTLSRRARPQTHRFQIALQH